MRCDIAQYLEAWLGGLGCVPLYNLMEDAATAEICRTQARPCCRCRGDLKCWCVTCTASTCPAFIGEWECYMHS